MKQHITPEQLNELTDTARNELREWWKPQPGDKTNGTGHDGPAFIGEYYYDSGYSVEDDKDVLPLLSIGQMIEFLGECGYNLSIEQMSKEPKPWWRVCYEEMLIDDHDELVDGLWQAVKEQLEDTHSKENQ